MLMLCAGCLLLLMAQGALPLPAAFRWLLDHQNIYVVQASELPAADGMAADWTGVPVVQAIPIDDGIMSTAEPETPQRGTRSLDA